MKRAWIALLLCVACGSLSAQRPISTPPRRVAFEANAPVDVLVGKLWWDIGLFHAFTGPISRDQWEKGYFGLMNKAVKPGADPAALAAEAVALLKDPASLVLETMEGQGGFFLPILWEVKGGKAWIIGGDKSLLAAPFGPVEKVNGLPIADFLSKRLGAAQSDDRAYAALTLASRRLMPFSTEFSSGAKKLSVRAVDKLADIKDPWIQGGWKGTSYLSLDDKKFASVEAIRNLPGGLDFRQSPWVDFANSSNLDSILQLLGASSPQNGVVRVVREHRGQYDEDWDRYAHDSGSYNRAAAYQAPNHMTWVKAGAPIPVTLPQVLLDPLLAEVLAGWALPAAKNTCAKAVRYAFLPGVDVRLRLESWCGGLADMKHHATYQNGHLLTVEAARALATASIINFDHLFSFTPEAMQSKVFSRALETMKVSKSAHDLVQRSGGITMDKHATAFSEAPFTSISERIHNPVLKNPLIHLQVAPVVPTFQMSNGDLRLIRSVDGFFEAGAILERANGIDLPALTRKIHPYTANREDNRDLSTQSTLEIGGEFGEAVVGPEPTPKTITFATRNPKTGEQKNLVLPFAVISSVMYEPYRGTLPAGWTLLQRPSPEDITQALEAGRKVVVDARVRKPIKGGFELPAPHVSPSLAGFRRTPFAPVAWGEPSANEVWYGQTETDLALRGFPQAAPSDQNKVTGTLVILVSGETVSQPELAATWLKEAFPKNTLVVGLPTGGSMGSRTVLALPVGGGKKDLALYGPTVSMDLINGRNYSYTGIPLDRQITEAEINAALDGGANDALMGALAKILEKM